MTQGPSRFKRLYYGLPLLLAAILVSLLIIKKQSGVRSELEIHNSLPAFDLVDQNNEKFTLDNLDPKVRVVNFMFSTCQSICPSLSQEMKYLQSHFSKFEKFELLSITVDPENDSPKQLKAWINHMKANTENWHFLTGPRENVSHLLEKGFRIHLPEKPEIHSDRFVLLDTQNRVRAYYQLSDKPSLERLRLDIFSLLRS